MTDLTVQMRIRAEAAQARREVKGTTADVKKMTEATKDVGDAAKTTSAKIKQAASEQAAAVRDGARRTTAAVEDVRRSAVDAGTALKRGMQDGAREERRTGDETDRLGERVRRMLRRVGDAGGVFRIMGRAATREVQSIRNSLTSLQGKLASLGVGYGIARAVRASAQRDREYVRMEQTAEMSPKQRDDMRAYLWTLAGQYGVEEPSLREGANVLLAKGFKQETVRASMGAVARASAVTGAAPSTLAQVASVAAKNFGIDLNKPELVNRMMDQMVVATRAGGMEMEDLADTIPTISKQATQMGLSFERSLALMEVMSSVVPDKARAATAVESGLRMFTVATYQRQVAKASGISHLFYDEKGNRQAPEYTLQKLREKYSGASNQEARDKFLSGLTKGMDNDTRAWLATMLSADHLDDLNAILAKVHVATNTVGKSLAENLQSATGVAGRMKGSFGAAFDRMSTPLNKAFAEAGEWILSKDLSGEDMPGIAAGGAVGARVLKRLGGAGLGKLAGLVGGGMDTVKNIAVGHALQDATGVMPVYVTNWSGAPGGAALGTAAAGLAEGTGASRAAGALAPAARVARGFVMTDALWAIGGGFALREINEWFAPARGAIQSNLMAKGRSADAKALGLSSESELAQWDALRQQTPYDTWRQSHAGGVGAYESWLTHQVKGRGASAKALGLSSEGELAQWDALGVPERVPVEVRGAVEAGMPYVPVADSAELALDVRALIGGNGLPRQIPGDTLLPPVAVRAWSAVLDAARRGDTPVLADGDASGTPVDLPEGMPSDALTAQALGLTLLGVTEQALATASAAASVIEAELQSPTLTPDDIERLLGQVRALIEGAILLHRRLATVEPALQVIEPLRNVAALLQAGARRVILAKPPLIERTVEADACLRSLAHRWYGDHRRATELLRLNPRLRSPYAVSRGEVLRAYAA